MLRLTFFIFVKIEPLTLNCEMRKYKASRSNDSHVSNNGTLNTNYLHYIWFNEYNGTHFKWVPSKTLEIHFPHTTSYMDIMVQIKEVFFPKLSRWRQHLKTINLPLINSDHALGLPVPEHRFQEDLLHHLPRDHSQADLPIDPDTPSYPSWRWSWCLLFFHRFILNL